MLNQSTIRTAIVIPMYNESGRIQTAVFRSFSENNTNLFFIFVNDGSTDNTSEKISNENIERSHLIELKQNQGKAEAVRIGMNWGLTQGYKEIGYWDADLATPLEAIGELLETLTLNQHASAVLGSRVKLLGRDINRKLYRHYIGRVFATCASMTLQLGIYDTQCGAKIFRSSDHLKSILKKPFLSKWVFDVEILARLQQFENLDNTIIEHPLKEWRDIAGSSLKITDFFVAFSDLIKIGFDNRQSKMSRKGNTL